MYGNKGGLGILEKLDMLLENDSRQMSLIMANQKNLDENQKNISSLESRVRLLAPGSDNYMSIRRRFIDVYKRDGKGMDELRGSKAIRDGDAKAHHGDALSDALLSMREGRTDASICFELCGVSYDRVLQYDGEYGSVDTSFRKLDSTGDDGGVCLVLNAYATKVANGQRLSDEFKSAFNVFLARLAEHRPQRPN